jgi:hypothetical protein
LLFAGSSFGQAPPQADKPRPGNPPPKISAPKEKPVAEMGLDEMLARALKDNPDIVIADAKLREAAAELNRTRLQVTQRVVTLQHALEAQRALVQSATADLHNAQVSADAIPAASLATKQQSLIAAKAKLAEIEAELPYLLGKQPEQRLSWQLRARLSGPLDSDVSRITVPIDIVTIDRRVSVAHLESANKTVPGTIADKIRKALDTPVTVDFKDKPFPDVLKDLQQKVKGVNFQISKVGLEPPDEMKVTLHYEDLPLGAVLQALADTFPEMRAPFEPTPGLHFVVRDYGILATFYTLPPGALLIDEFWKGGDGTHKPESGAAKNPPAKRVDGEVKASDPRGLVTVNIGADAGIAKGQTLEVYRLKPSPKYLGTIRILEVRANEAVGRPIAAHPTEEIKIGDRVTSEILGQR